MADFNSKYSGEQVEALLDQVASGNAGGGGGGITAESDPVFSASPAATITEQKIAEWDSKSEQGEKGDKGDKGDTGVGVQSVAQTTTSNADGGSNVVTVTLTDGTKSTFTVKNGSKGSSGSNGTNGKDGADGATFTPSVDSAGNLSWTNNKGLTNPPTVNIKGPKGDAGEGGGSSGGEEVIQWTMRYVGDYIDDNGVISLDPFVVYYGGDFSDGGTILFNCPPNSIYNEWRIIFFKASDNSLNVGVDKWVNGIVPDISKQGIYELSVVDNEGILLGVMAHFPIE